MVSTKSCVINFVLVSSFSMEPMLKVEHLRNRSPTDPLYISLTTETRQDHGKDGVLVTVGRDRGDIQFNSFKAVSRVHCVLRLITNEPGEPKNSSIPLTYLAVEDLGSTHGTFVQIEKSTNSQTPIRLEAHKPLKLMPWSSSTKSPFASDEFTSVIISCGPEQVNTSGQIKITSIPMNICTTQLTKEELQELTSFASLLGIPVTNDFDTEYTTHVVAGSKQSTAKTLCAFLKGVPIVRTSFVKALSERKNISCPLPQIEEYAVYTEPKDMPWDISDNLSEKRKTCMKGFKVLCLQKREIESLILEAGGSLERLYSIENAEWTTEEWWDQLAQNKKQDKSTIIWLENTSSKVKGGKLYLVEKMKELRQKPNLSKSDLQIFCVEESAIARRIKTLEPLTDVDQTALGTTLVSIDSKDDSSSIIIIDTKDLELVEKESSSNGKESYRESDKDNVPTTDVQSSKRGFSQSTTKSSSKVKATGWLSSQRRKNTVEDPQEERKSQSQEGISIDVSAQTSHNISTESAHLETDQAKLPLPKGKNGWLKAAPCGKKRALYRSSVEDDIEGMVPALTELRSDLVVRNSPNRCNIVHVSLSGTVVDYKRFKKNPIIQGSKMSFS